MRAMYTPSLFRCDDRALTLAVAANSPFAIWIATNEDGTLEITHLPSLIVSREEQWVVHAHVARANPLAALALRGKKATVVFSGPHAYVSPTWYERPHEHVPTWSYVTVHAIGQLRAQDDADTRQALRALATQFEGPQGWSPDHLGDREFEQLARAVTGIELVVTDVEHKRKLSQNRSTEDRRRVLERFRASGDPQIRAVAEAMTSCEAPTSQAGP